MLETKPVVSVSNLTKRYGNYSAVNSISFSVGKGEVLGLLGPNGAGKTTTLECLEGLKSPQEGTIRISGIDPKKQPAKIMQKIGVQLQSSGLPENITPLETLKIFSAYRGISPRLDLLRRFGLEEKQTTQYQALSTGMKRRLSLALAVAHDPEVLFLDEPTAGLDVASRVELHEMIRELKQKGTTIILATHDMAEAEALADRIVILLQGEIVASGSPMQITTQGGGLTKISVKTADGTLEGRCAGFPGVKSSAEGDGYSIVFSEDIGTTVSSIIREIETSNDRLIDLRVQRPSLEERFLEITELKGV